MLLISHLKNVNIQNFNIVGVLFLLMVVSVSCSDKVLKTKPLSFTDLQFCTFDFEQLKKVGGTEVSNQVYFFKEKKYSGCARASFKDREGSFVYAFEDGQMTRQLGWYPNGQLERDFNFKNGLSHDSHLMYYEDGRKYIEEIYENGQPIKLLRWFNNGQLARETYFENGEKIKEMIYEKL